MEALRAFCHSLLLIRIYCCYTRIIERCMAGSLVSFLIPPFKNKFTSSAIFTLSSIEQNIYSDIYRLVSPFFSDLEIYSNLSMENESWSDTRKCPFQKVDSLIFWGTSWRINTSSKFTWVVFYNVRVTKQNLKIQKIEANSAFDSHLFKTPFLKKQFPYLNKDSGHLSGQHVAMCNKLRRVEFVGYSPKCNP
jgi:hypothetical protein